MKKIIKEIAISELLEQLPEAAEVLLDLGVGCVGCAMSSFETLEQGLMGHGFTEEEIKDVIDDLNELAEHKEK